MQAIETTVTVDSDGSARGDQPIPVAPGRHRAVLVIDEAVESQPHESWPDFIARTYGSLADVDLVRPPQGEYERQEVIA
jgi:hypothetical protein